MLQSNAVVVLNTASINLKRAKKPKKVNIHVQATATDVEAELISPYYPPSDSERGRGSDSTPPARNSPPPSFFPVPPAVPVSTAVIEVKVEEGAIVVVEERTGTPASLKYCLQLAATFAYAIALVHFGRIPLSIVVPTFAYIANILASISLIVLAIVGSYGIIVVDDASKKYWGGNLEQCRNCRLSEHCAWLMLVPMCCIVDVFALMASILCAPFWLIISPDGFKETWRNIACWRGSESFFDAVTNGRSSQTCWVDNFLAFFVEVVTEEEIETATRLKEERRVEEEVRKRKREEERLKKKQEKKEHEEQLKREQEGAPTCMVI